MDCAQRIASEEGAWELRSAHRGDWDREEGIEGVRIGGVSLESQTKPRHAGFFPGFLVPQGAFSSGRNATHGFSPW